jgi:hypothetical protein
MKTTLKAQWIKELFGYMAIIKGTNDGGVGMLLPDIRSII